MQENGSRYSAYIEVLKEELVPAMGCTEPIALAYAAAKARELLGMIPCEVLCEASGSIIKNVKSVVVPNTGGLRGIGVAAAAGIVAGRADQKLQVLSQVTAEEVEAIHRFLERVPIQIKLLDEGYIFDIRVTVSAGGHHASVRMINAHTNIVSMEKDGFELLNRMEETGREKDKDRSFLSLEGIWDFVNQCNLADVEDMLEQQMNCNLAIAKEGLENPWGSGVGRTILETCGNNPQSEACAWAAAASDARMNGCELPVVINSGSGNQGISCSVPVCIYASNLGAGRDQTLRALLLSNLITIYEKAGVGCLSAYCGAVCAGAGAGAGIAYLQGGSYDEVAQTVSNALAVVSGIICDGAKSSCAAKIAVSVNAGIVGFHMARQRRSFLSGEGIVAESAERTIQNVGRLARRGMDKTNLEIISMMTENA